MHIIRSKDIRAEITTHNWDWNCIEDYYVVIIDLTDIIGGMIFESSDPYVNKLEAFIYAHKAISKRISSQRLPLEGVR